MSNIRLFQPYSYREELHPGAELPHKLAARGAAAGAAAARLGTGRSVGTQFRAKMAPASGRPPRRAVTALPTLTERGRDVSVTSAEADRALTAAAAVERIAINNITLGYLPVSKRQFRSFRR